MTIFERKSIMSLNTKIALAMSADGDSFERVHDNLVKIAEDFAIEFAEWCQDHIILNDGKELLEIYKKEKAAENRNQKISKLGIK